MVRPIVRETAYRLYLMNKIREWHGAGQGDFTVDMLARFAGLKPTGNMYRQLRSFVDDGSLSLVFGYRKQGIRANVYSITIDPAMRGQ